MSAPPAPLLAAHSHLAKWHEREPELAVLDAFMAPHHRALWAAWAALLIEFDEAMFEVSDPTVARTKLAWWGEDLAAGTAARHPLAKHLLQQAHLAGVEVAAADWRQLAVAALAVALDQSAGQPQWLQFTGALAQMESRLFDATSSASTVAAQWRFSRCVRAVLQGRPERARLPAGMRVDSADWLALPAGGDSGRRFWSELAAGWLLAEHPGNLLYRQVRARTDALRLDRLARGEPMARAMPIAALRVLWHAWSAARQRQGGRAGSG